MQILIKTPKPKNTPRTKPEGQPGIPLSERKKLAEKNPVLRIRLELEPTSGEKRARSSNFSKSIPHLTQSELARRFNCHVSTIQFCERDELWPRQLSLKTHFKKQYWNLFGDDELHGVYKELLFDEEELQTLKSG